MTSSSNKKPESPNDLIISSIIFLLSFILLSSRLTTIILKKIILNYIRSYVQQEITFQEGMSLLSGDIGSGKSTILLAVDFALFGIRNPDLPGSSLLRNGTRQGSVELHVIIDNNYTIVKRVLKRSASVTQDYGSVSVNGTTKELTATEIRQKVLNLLNYPQEFLTKSKSLIYKYTVYTPQEEMKAILLGENEQRLDILRKIFGIDRYKCIKENSRIIVSRLREKRREFLGFISDIHEKKAENDRYISSLNQLKNELGSLLLSFKAAKKKLEDVKKKDEAVISKKEKFQKIKNEITMADKTIADKNWQLEKISGEITAMGNEISEEPAEMLFDEKSIHNKKTEMDVLEQEIITNNDAISRLKTKEEFSNKLIDEIARLNECPTCRQIVSQEHKNNICSHENSFIQNIMPQLNEAIKKNKELYHNLDICKTDMERLHKEKREAEVARLRIRMLAEKKERKERLLVNKSELEAGIEKLILLKSEKASELGLLKDIEAEYKAVRADLEAAMEEERRAEIKKISAERDIEGIKNNIARLEAEIQNKEKIRKELESLDRLQEWIGETFVRLIDGIEKQVMLRIYNVFNSLFVKWFDMLVENDVLSAALSKDFAPVIEQNGYETDYLYLSGGEKTAAALAYRLALNQVINNLLTTIRTKDILILDEPTDGFSSHQLDKVKEVLDELRIKQIILVSHDAKVESFADHIIRIEKKGHISSVY